MIFNINLIYFTSIAQKAHTNLFKYSRRRRLAYLWFSLVEETRVAGVNQRRWMGDLYPGLER